MCRLGVEKGRGIKNKKNCHKREREREREGQPERAVKAGAKRRLRGCMCEEKEM